MENCEHTICHVLSVFLLYYPACKVWLFEKFIFALEASYSFKITCILVRQEISLKKNGVISKIYGLVSWFPICTPLILLSALMKMASISTTVIYNSMRVDTPDDFLCKGKIISSRPFILVLDWLLVYATSIMWTNLSLYNQI